MKLLICTQKVDKNDSVLGFFHRWLEEFAKHFEFMTVIALQVGEYELPKNVKVLSLGKENGASKIKYIFNFYKYIWREKKNYSAVFVHMNPEYCILGGWLWKLLNKKISLWYVHRQVNLKLKIAEFFANKIFSVSHESFKLKSKKVNFVGHGIDMELFKCEAEQKETDIFKIISVGRITRIKNLDVLIKAANLLLQKNPKIKFVVELIGESVTTDDKEYKKELKELIEDLSLGEVVKFSGAKLYAQLPDIYCQSDLLVNLAPTGGLDKAVLEAMSCGVMVLVSNKAFGLYLGTMEEHLVFDYNNEIDLADKVIILIGKSEDEREVIGELLKSEVRRKHDLKQLIKELSQ